MEHMIRKLLKRRTILDFYEGMDDYLDEMEFFDEWIYIENLAELDEDFEMNYEMNYEIRKQIEYVAELLEDPEEKKAV